MEWKMSVTTRKELLRHIQARYQKANSRDKSKILDEFCTLTTYGRKYAIHLLSLEDNGPRHNRTEKCLKSKKYNEAIRQALLTLWNAANQICSKRLVPFIPDLLCTLERFGHISLPEDVRNRLLSISPATVDRLLETVRKDGKKGLCTTASGSLLKQQIKIRTFADWNDVVPGFLEGDLVAHCGTTTQGVYLNTLVITDIASTWTEFFPLLVKGEAGVISALRVAQALLPFALLGLDTDNGSEFINYALLEFCKSNAITFTRSRAYKKNDQAHVEERNGSIIRRLIGYDRYEGLDAYNALSELYSVLRLYVNFFQPSLKLLSKKREGAKVTKKYDKAKTPYQRLMLSSHLTLDEKDKLKQQYDQLDPVELLKKLVDLQNNFWKHAWKPTDDNVLAISETEALINEITHSKINKVKIVPCINSIDTASGQVVSNNNLSPQQSVTKVTPQSPNNIRRYRHTKKPRKNLGRPLTWRTCPDAFVNEWMEIKIQLELNPSVTAKIILENLIKNKPDEFNISQLRTLQRRVSQWRLNQLKMHQEMQSKKITIQDESAELYLSLAAKAVLSTS
jgi:hypothetical protein